MVDTGRVAEIVTDLYRGRKEAMLKTCAVGKRIIPVMLLSLLAACSSTRLTGSVLTAEKKPAAGMEVLIKAEPGDGSKGTRSTRMKPDGTFDLRGLEPNTIYRITAICEADNTRARVDNIYVTKGKNELAENKMLILAVHKPTPAIEDTSKGIESGKGKVIPENP
jgi:hypothetical protein